MIPSNTVSTTVIAIAVGVLFRGTGVTDRVARSFALLPLPVPHVVAGLLGVEFFASNADAAITWPDWQ